MSLDDTLPPTLHGQQQLLEYVYLHVQCDSYWIIAPYLSDRQYVGSNSAGVRVTLGADPSMHLGSPAQ